MAPKGGNCPVKADEGQLWLHSCLLSPLSAHTGSPGEEETKEAPWQMQRALMDQETPHSDPARHRRGFSEPCGL